MRGFVGGNRPMGDREELEVRLFHHPLARIYRVLDVCPPLARVCRLLEERHDDSDLTLSRAARECAIESSHLNHRLRTRTGWTFHQLLIRRRVLHAAGILETTEQDLPTVAHRSGFGSVRSLHRNFRRLLGESPARYRRRKIDQLLSS